MQPTAPLRYVFDIRRGDDARFHSQRTCRQTLRRECDLPVRQRLGIERSPSNRDEARFTSLHVDGCKAHIRRIGFSHRWRNSRGDGRIE